MILHTTPSHGPQSEPPSTPRRAATAKTYYCRPPRQANPTVRQGPAGSEDLAALLTAGARHFQRGRVASALAAFDQAQALAPEDPAAHLNRAVVLRRLGRLDEARRSFERAVALAPDWPETRRGLAGLLLEQGAAAAAVAHLEHASRLDPESAEIRHALGIALRQAEWLADSVEHLRLALKLRPGWSIARHNLAVSLQALGREDEALAEYERLVAADCDLWESHNNLAFLLLRRGDYRRGFRELEWRFQQGGETPRRLNRPQPVWRGESLVGKTLLLCEELGAGDMMQFVRLARAIPDLGGRVIVECGASLRRLFETVPGVDACIDPHAACPEADFQLPLLSLPRLLDLTLDTVPASVPYVSAREDPSRIAGLDEWLASFSGRFKVGIVWAGSSENGIDRLRSSTPEAFAPLAEVPEVELFSLQFAPPSVIDQRLGDLPIRSLAPWLGDFAHTAAVLERLDLVVTVDTSMAHLASALGRETWVLLHSPGADWRWLENRQDSPWYPTLRLFRQPRPGDWPGAVAQVASALRARLGRQQEAP